MRQCYRLARVALVIPCYNEANRLDTAAFKNFRLPSDQIEFVFVNDGSTDGTLQLLQTLPGSVVNLERNSGKAEAVRRGILAALDRKPDIVGFWDADLATPFSELPGFLAILSSFLETRSPNRTIAREPSF